jgi:predicted CopG family antitoxin
MAVKTITIDLAAYEALARRKRGGESFSDVIKAHFAVGGTGRDLLEAARRASLSDATVEAAAAMVAARRKSKPRVPRW